MRNGSPPVLPVRRFRRSVACDAVEVRFCVCSVPLAYFSNRQGTEHKANAPEQGTSVACDSFKKWIKRYTFNVLVALASL